MAKLLVNFNIKPDTSIRIGYREANTAFPFTYLPNYAKFNESPVTIDNLPDGSYEVEVTPISSNCSGKPCGDPIRILANTEDPNTIYAHMVISIDVNNRVFFQIEFSQPIPASVTVSGQYTVAEESKNFNVIVPQGESSYAKAIDSLVGTVDSYCYNSITPNIIGNKQIIIQNAEQC